MPAALPCEIEGLLVDTLRAHGPQEFDLLTRHCGFGRWDKPSLSLIGERILQMQADGIVHIHDWAALGAGRALVSLIKPQ